LLAWPLLGERYSWLQAAGALLVLASIFVVNLQAASSPQMLAGE
jgi:drug/metabolite transporter (DMT)-like permease